MTVVGWLLDVRRFGPRAVLTLDDRSMQISVPLSEEQWLQHAEQLRKDSLLLVSGRLGPDDFSGGYQLRPNEILDLDALYARRVARLDLHLHAGAGYAEELAGLLEGARASSGCALFARLSDGSAEGALRFPADLRLRLSDPLLRRLQQLLGESAVQLCWQPAGE